MTIKCHYYWQDMKIDIQQDVEHCLQCQVSNVEQIKSLGLLQPHEVTHSKFESISMDFIVSLPKTQINYDSMFVIVGWLTNIAHFTSTMTTMTTLDIANLFMKNTFKIYGMPS